MAERTGHPALECSSREAAAAATAAECAGAMFRRTYFEHGPLMRYMAIHRLGIPDSAAEDLVHDIFTSYLANPSVVRGDLRTYLLGAVWNAARHYRRKHGREAPLDSAPEPVSPDVADRLATQLTVARVLAELRPECREALQRVHGENERGADVASSMHRSCDALYQLLSNCRRQARALFHKLARGSAA
jgi:DNA-directed RNA polymerase specialized sigma24 family protein